MSHRLPVRVYYEDTDLAGIVYYANYLKFIERGRSEWIRDLGLDQSDLKARLGVVFAVRRIEADYLAPARFDDLVVVTTDVLRLTGARITLRQGVLCGSDLLFAAEVTLVALSPSGAPARLPAELRTRLGPPAPGAMA